MRIAVHRLKKLSVFDSLTILMELQFFLVLLFLYSRYSIFTFAVLPLITLVSLICNKSGDRLYRVTFSNYFKLSRNKIHTYHFINLLSYCANLHICVEWNKILIANKSINANDWKYFLLLIVLSITLIGIIINFIRAFGLNEAVFLSYFVFLFFLGFMKTDDWPFYALVFTLIGNLFLSNDMYRFIKKRRNGYKIPFEIERKIFKKKFLFNFFIPIFYLFLLIVKDWNFTQNWILTKKTAHDFILIQISKGISRLVIIAIFTALYQILSFKLNNNKLFQKLCFKTRKNIIKFFER
ncbi:hypothetical protein ACVRXQ_07440 [Streptococcus panodentis]|uniref:Uncharacterized protein n=1 Tax=Streptococcus panodentis TaxID=1581472 RepID=A0ABS5AXF9_9STRE|nr:hypothetical protein [Streptococcus panodentis]MBP2621269.1 hypothetical protein [Streptococcus panodentis]